MSLGNNISFLRKQKKFTQEQLADRMGVTRQTVSRWESNEVVPELDRLVEMCAFFACKLDALVREDLSDQSEIYSEIRIKRIAPFKMASYVIVSSDPESDALGHMDRWAESSGLKQVCPDVKFLGWDFPFVSQELQNRFGLHDEHIHIGDIIFRILMFKAADDMLLMLFLEIVGLKVFHNQLISVGNPFKGLNEWLFNRDYSIIGFFIL